MLRGEGEAARDPGRDPSHNWYFQQMKNGNKSHHDTETQLDTDASGPEKDDLYLDLINP